MTTANSPTYAAGVDDGTADMARIQSCPRQEPVGPSPPIPAYPTMYMRGYWSSYDSTGGHQECDNCRPKR